MPNRVGAVVVFKDGVTRERAAWLLADLARVDIVEPVEASDIQEFDPRCGVPVWHIPIDPMPFEV